MTDRLLGVPPVHDEHCSAAVTAAADRAFSDDTTDDGIRWALEPTGATLCATCGDWAAGDHCEQCERALIVEYRAYAGWVPA